MPMTTAGLSAAIKAEMILADPTITEVSLVEAQANALGKAIVTYLKAEGLVIIPIGAIATTGDAINQAGPAIPVPLNIT